MNFIAYLGPNCRRFWNPALRLNVAAFIAALLLASCHLKGSKGLPDDDAPQDTDAAGDSTRPPLPANETGADLWLRYPLVAQQERREEYRHALSHLVNSGNTPTLDVAVDELQHGITGLTGTAAIIDEQPPETAESIVLVGTPASSELVARSTLAARLPALGTQGYLVEATQVNGKPSIVVAGNTDLGVLYGSFALLRHLQMQRPLSQLSLQGRPPIARRLLNHWDNLDGSVERGYAGTSLWDWNALPNTLSPRYKAYARANAAIGINGAVLTNVNADEQILSSPYLSKVAAIAATLRPYGIAVYLTTPFDAPLQLNETSSADPKSETVKQWWAAKTQEIYEQIPDFGGFLIKANSEGQSGPQAYQGTHADGANLLADALAPHGGIVLWRAFVYAGAGVDRIREAYDEFRPLDGKFRDNVVLQVKNGPLDFQPREPFSPLFGAMPKTSVGLEVQVTKEYLGNDTHLAYLGSLFEETLQSDTFAQGAGSTVARVIDGSLNGAKLSAMSGVANIGSDLNWTGSHFNQANWYAFGRLAWDPDANAAAVAEEWVRLTFSNDPALVVPVVNMLLTSRQTLVDYMTPLGLAHIMASEHHYGPAPWENSLSRPEWNPVYYHKADVSGIGFDRTATGSNALEQYSPTVRAKFENRQTVPEELLLFFHHVGWQEKLSSGRSLWQELVFRYSRGVDAVGELRSTWQNVAPYVDAERFQAVADFLEIQHYEARWWRDACLQYFASVAQLAIPAEYSAPQNSLSSYQNLRCPLDQHRPRCPDVYRGTPSPALPSGGN